MSERPTPETEAAVIASNGQWSYVLRETCERLERERDEARQDLEEEMKFHHRTHGECVIAQCELMDVERERDEAREAFAIAADQLVQAQSALREIHTIVQMRFAEWAPANDLNNGSEEATK